VTGDRNRFVADAFHQIAVACDHEGAVIDQRIAKARIQNPLCQCHPHRIGQTLAKRSRRGLDAGRVAIFGMAGARATKLAKMLDVLDPDIGIAGQIKERIQQHGAVPGGQDEAVAVGPVGIGRVVFEKVGEQDRGCVRHAHGQAWVAACRFLDSVHRQRAYRVGQSANVCLLRRCDGFVH